ncbi:cobaltochelatase subunit CobN [Methanospirillum hungatei]|uniref:cobaltochelatase subunit CobN n=1 Tax=Methanospirillum hungatei TaxID=2203 RepID=UPI001B53E425|nr:cobaltochelatase subunit CobN [Methanospirillum hungatei]MBP9007384.1 cobaltochelatase subunit CobN [Methanospirillum sp.]HOW04894.1 cobaltochelatase subunit CobN [Methanospirillum hungatei]
MDAASTCRDNGRNAFAFQATSELLDSEEKEFTRILNELQDTHLLLIDNHGSATYFKKFDRLIAKANDLHIPTFVCSSVPDEMKDFRNLFPFSTEEYEFVHSCLELSGLENTTALILWACKTIGEEDIDIPPLRYPPTEGFYHPSLPDIYDFVSHEKRLVKEKPTIGILLHQFYYIRKNLLPIDALILSLEAKGMNALPFFLVTSPNEVTGAIGIRKFIETYLIRDGKPIIDVLIINMSFSQISLSDPGDGTKNDPIYNFFIDLNVPLLQTITMYRSYEAWAQDDQGLSVMEISSGVIWPEFDGQIIAIPLGSTGEYEGRKNVGIPIPGRVERIAEMALRWSILKRTPINERKIAILLYQYTGETEALGDAGGLDTPQSVIKILQKLKDTGYGVDHIPETGNELIEGMIAGLTNDTRWISEKQMRERTADLVSPLQYQEWFSKIPTKNQEKISDDWGPAPGEVLVAGGDFCIPGQVNGNIFIGIQPPRGLFEKVESLIHSNDMVMPHQYLAYYRWIKHVFGAHVVIHMGTHGTLEWLPGKGNALSEECCPDVILEDMPHIYPYIMNDPGEGIQAKRRSWSVLLDHLVPAMMRAEGYGDLLQLDTILQDYLRAKRGGEEQKAKDLITEVRSIVLARNLTYDLGLPVDAEIEVIAENAERLYDYICEVRDVIIKDGLHIFGQPPADERFLEMIYALTRLENGKVPSLRESVAKTCDLSLQDLLENPSGFNIDHQLTNGALVDLIDSRCQQLIEKMAEVKFDRDLIIFAIQEEYGEHYKDLETCCMFICDEVVSRLNQTTDELTNMIRGLDAGYVPPGPCGDPTRGNVHLLPTGRNCYSIDPATIPTPAAWKTGKDMADQMIERYITEKGEYPQKVGIVVWATDTMRTGGDDIAYILWLMGLRPIWSSRGGTVTGLEVIPAKELARPRIDVTLRISGLFRDSYPNLVQLIDEGVEIIATLDESDEVNFLSAHLKQDMLARLKEGLSEQEARDMALVRIFGDPPGNHGCAVGEVVHASSWKDRKDLADVYTTWGAHAYGRKFRGEKVPELFKEQFAQLDVTVKNRVSREFDILDVDDDYIFLGGMNACVKAYGNKDPVSVIGEASDPKNVKTRLLDEEIRFIFRSRVLNPRWIDGLKPHGFRGVQEVMNTIEYTFGWDVTSDAVDDWEYQAAAEHFLFDEENRKWIEENNPYAMHNIAGRLLEAYERGFWETDDETIKKLQDIFLESEEYLEQMGDLHE